MDSLVDYLSGKGIRTWPAAGSEVTAHCFFLCNHDKLKGKLYLNQETWLFDCKRCGTQGGRKFLLGHFGDHDDTTWLPGANPVTRMQLLADYTALTVQLLENNEDKLLYLLRRGLSAETIMDAKLGYVPPSFSVCGSLEGYSRKDFEAAGVIKGGGEFHAGRITIPYTDRDQVLQIRGKVPDGKYWTPAGDSVRLYRAESLRGAAEAIITEGEFDALILAQALQRNPNGPHHKAAVVGLPGAGAWPGGKEHFPDYFREAKRVYIALDADDTGAREAVKLKDALGSKARIVTLPEDPRVKVDWTEWLRPADAEHPAGGHTATDVDELLAEADMVGRRIFSVSEAALRWKKDKEERPGLKLGFESLDAVIQPGLRPGNVCVPMAKTGTGKTVLLANLDYNLRDRRVLHVTLENTVTEVFELLWRIYHFWHPAAEDFQITKSLPWLRIVDANRLTGEDLATLVEEYTLDVGEPPEVLQIDYLGYLARGQRGSSPYEKVSEAVMQLKSMAKSHELAVIAPHQASRAAQEGQAFEGHEARDSGVVEETADFMFGLYRPGDAADKSRTLAHGAVTSELHCQIIKSRRGGKGRVIKLASSPASLAIADYSHSHAVQRIQVETQAFNSGYTYEQIAASARSTAFQRAQLRLA